ncbi:MAG: FxsA family protein [Tabrizicola sp.]|nr:FxsA family protein [Tabrizicola sp.]
MWLILSFLAIPLIEIGLFVQIGGAIGVWATLAWVLVSAAIGMLILRGIGIATALTLRQDIGRMRDPVSPLAHRAIMALAAMLLVLPGFFTDAMGLLLLVPPVRSALIAFVASRVRIIRTGPTAQGDVIEGDWQEAPDDQKPDRSLPPSGWTRH